MNALGTALARGLAGATVLALSIAVARIDGVDAVGAFGLTVVLATFLAVLADAGVSGNLVPALAREPETKWARMWATTMRYQALSAVPVGAVTGGLGLLYGGQVGESVIVAIPWVLATRLSFTARAFLAVAERLEWDAGAGSIEFVAAVSLGFAALVAGLGPSGAIGGMAVGAMLGALVRAIGVVRPLAAASAPGSVTALLGEAKAFASFNVLVLVYSRIDVVFVSSFATAASLGLYQAPVRVITALLLVPEALSLVLQGRAARAPRSLETVEMQRRVLDPAFCIAILCAAVLVPTGDTLLAAVFGDEFRAVGAAFALLAFVVPLRVISYLNANQLIANRLQAVRLRRMAIVASFAVIAGIPAVVLFGYVGAAAATLASEALLAGLYVQAVGLRVAPGAILLPFVRIAPKGA